MTTHNALPAALQPRLRHALFAAVLVPGLLSSGMVRAQSDQFYEKQFEQPAPKRTRVKRDDAFKATDEGPGLGTLSSSGASSGSPIGASGVGGPYPPPYPPASDVAQGYGTPPPYGSPPPPYGSAPPPPYSSAPPPYSGSPDYGSVPPPSRPYPSTGAAANDAYRPPAGSGGYGAPPPPPPYDSRAASNYGGPGGYSQQGGGFGQPYSAPPSDEFEPRDGYNKRPYMSGEDNRRPPYRDERSDGTFSSNEIMAASHNFFGAISQGLASVIEYAFKRQGRPNGYILGEDAGAAFVAGLRYGEGRLYTKDAGSHKVYWQGPSLGYDVGAEGSKVMVLVYNLRDPNEIYERFGGVAGSAYVIGGVGLTFQTRDHIVLAPIRSGVGLRLGANVGYLKYTPRPTWNPF